MRQVKREVTWKKRRRMTLPSDENGLTSKVEEGQKFEERQTLS